MRTKPAAMPRWIVLGILAVLLLALAAFMLLSPNAPRRAQAPAASAAPETILTLYEGTRTMTSSPNARITANGHELFVYDVMVNHEHIWNANTQPSDTPMTYFDFSGKVEIDIEMPGLPTPVESAQVLPSAWGIEPEVADGHVRFAITEPGQYTVIYNGSVNKATHIFANPPETEVPDADDPYETAQALREAIVDGYNRQHGLTPRRLRQKADERLRPRTIGRLAHHAEGDR